MSDGAVKLVKGVRRVDDGVAKAERLVVALAMMVMVGSIFIQAMLRYVFDTGLPWPEEVSRFLLVWSGFLGASIATHDRKHLIVDALPKLVERKNPDSQFLKILRVISAAIAGGFSIFLVYSGAKFLLYIGMDFESAVWNWEDGIFDCDLEKSMWACSEFRNYLLFESRTSTAMEVPMWIVQAAIPVTMAMISLRFLWQFVEELMLAMGKLPPEMEVKSSSLADMIGDNDDDKARQKAVPEPAGAGADSVEPAGDSAGAEEGEGEQ